MYSSYQMAARRFAHLFFLCFLVGTLQFPASARPDVSFELAPLRTSLIEYYKNKINKRVRYDRYIRAGVTAGMIGLIGLCCYQFVTPSPAELHGSQLPIPASGPSDLSLLPLNQQDKQDLLVVAQELKATRETVYPTGWTARLKSIGSYLASQTIINVCAGAILGAMTPLTKYIYALDKAVDACIERIFHDNSLQWFASSHMNEFKATQLLKSYAQRIDDAQPHDCANESMIKLFNIGWQLYAKQTALLLGFLEYKRGLFPSNKQYAQFFAQHIETITTSFEQTRQTLNDVLHNLGIEHKKPLVSCVDQVENLQHTIDVVIKDVDMFETALAF